MPNYFQVYVLSGLVIWPISAKFGDFLHFKYRIEDRTFGVDPRSDIQDFSRNIYIYIGIGADRPNK